MPKGNHGDRRGRPPRRVVRLPVDTARKLRDLTEQTGEEADQYIQRLIEEQDMPTPPPAYLLGAILARVEHANVIKALHVEYEKLIRHPSERLPLLVTMLQQAGKGDMLIDLMAKLPNVPDTLTLEEQSSFALGYYHEKVRINRGPLAKGDGSYVSFPTP